MIDLTLKEYLNMLSSDSPTPGGGSSLALVTANGIALLMMACNVTVTKLAKKQLQCNVLEQCVTDLKPLFQQAMELVDKDGQAFQAILHAMKLPKDTEQQILHRKQTLQSAYVDSAEVCLSLMQTAVSACRLSAPAIEFSDVFVVSDAVIGLDILMCATKCQRHNVEVNANCITDVEVKKSILDRMNQLLALATV